jgi:hypothetical protein
MGKILLEWLDDHKAKIVVDPEYKQMAKDWEGSVRRP